MLEKTLNLPGPDGEIPLFVTCPEREGPHPVVIFYMDAPGIREELRDMARRIATVGFYVVMPNLWYRWGGVSFTTNNRPAAEQEKMMALLKELTNAMVLSDTRVMLDWIAAQPEAAKAPMGCIGYCMSGQFVISVMGTMPETFQAGASLHGVGNITDKPDSPHLLADKISGELYFGFAEDDPHVPLSEVDELGEVLKAKGVAHEIEVHPGTLHGFVFPERACYVKDASERQWERVFSLFRRRLGGAAARAA